MEAISVDQAAGTVSEVRAYAGAGSYTITFTVTVETGIEAIYLPFVNK